MRKQSLQNQLARSLGKANQILTDADLLAACREGNERAWEALIERYEALIYTVARRTGLSQNDASDVFQEVCLILLKNLQDIRDSDRLGGWLATTAKREALRMLGRKRPVNESELLSPDSAGDAPLSLIPSDAPLPEVNIMELENSRLVSMGFDELSNECREILSFLYACEPPLSYQEAAERVNRPVGSIGPMRARCLKSLQEILKKLGW